MLLGNVASVFSACSSNIWTEYNFAIFIIYSEVLEKLEKQNDIDQNLFSVGWTTYSMKNWDLKSNLKEK